VAAYLDTSLLVALFFHEEASAAARKRAGRDDRLWVSRWTLAEFASAVAYKLRTAQTDETTALEAKRRLLEILAADGLQVVDIERADLERSAVLCEAHASGLRSPDALHAAVAMRLRMTLLTADRGQAAGCGFHSITCELVGSRGAGPGR
jgi:predicted nucleic acid-binding protein